MRLRHAFFAATALLASAAPASAAVISRQYSLTTVFTSGPNATITTDLNVTFDNAVTGVVTVNSFSSAALGSYTPVSGYFYSSTNRLYFGNNYIGGGMFVVTSGQNQFFGFFNLDASGNGTNVNTTNNSITYSNTAAQNTIYFSNSGLVVTGATPAVPEPATWAMMLVGFGAMGVAMRRRAKVRAVRFA